MTTVFLHPVGLDRDCWQFSRLTGEMVDYPGHGARPLPASGRFVVEDVADDIAARCAGTLDLVGLSFGVTIALYLALRHPHRVRSMLLACGGGSGSSRPDRAEQTLRGMAATVAPTLERWFTRAALDTPDHPGVRYARERLLADDPAGVAAIWAADRSLLTARTLATVTAPVTVLGGRHDAATGRPRLLELFDRLPNSRLEIVTGPHMLPLERPIEFQDAVTRHAAWVDAAFAGAAVGGSSTPADPGGTP